MQGVHEVVNFIDLNYVNVLYLIGVGFVGGLVSGFIGSGGAFVLTPGMMSLGVPGLVAVASNMCHKFPKALVGAIKRAKYGQVDLKLGLIFGAFAEAGVLYGATIQQKIKAAYGDAGSNLYVSAAFVLILATVGTFVLRDALKTKKSGSAEQEEKLPKLARWVQSIHIPGTMVYFKSLKARVSVIFIILPGIATGLMAATIAVGGFVGVPSLIYVLGAPSLMASATELVVAFVMGMGGSFKYALHGFVDFRLTALILAGSLFGIQLGAMGTTYVKPYMIKLVMGAIMVTVLFSRALMIPVYLSNLGWIGAISETTTKILKTTSFGIMAFALLMGAFIILKAMFKGRREEQELAKQELARQQALEQTT